ncbi:MAG: PIN domain-containing protein [Planctomycetota bacterium]
MRPAVCRMSDAAANESRRAKLVLPGPWRPIAPLDALIASLALVSDQTLITRDPQHFSRVPRFRVRGY